ncbi:MAG: iron ABC transporter permease [Bosea sp. (in: a-proteobacteria)]|uniref:ABC transporter permease n=1 Tax=Bosea sp. (in: a-proteobacteria) TaxID=1871050 RepID=UPI0027331F36|nr:iron ABC transporter permease [Bosea sp. (in: a-proteobacteria)]MDP3602241.1 iron ABC transporter permease [Bosea sp. (in: a-proteobacteria)]
MSLSVSRSEIRRPPLRGRPSTRLVYVALLGAGLVLLPVLALALTALSSQAASIWPHLAANVLPAALRDTGLLLLGVGLLCGLIGVGTAWLVTQFEFPGRRSLEWLLVLPLALPTYITAYVYVEVLGFQGPFQSALRALTGWRSLRDYWFPDPRNLPGAICIMAIVLYPYVYLSVRALFGLQAAAIVESARTLGAAPGRLFWRIGLPMARPALAAGLTLVLLETLNDIGASEYLGVRSLTLSIYTTWVNRNSLAGAAQIACVMLLLVVLLMGIEARLRGQRRFALPVRQPRAVGRVPLQGGRAAAATLACALPVLFGALLPIGFLATEVLRRGLWQQLDGAMLRALFNALAFSGLASGIVILLGVGIAAARRQGREPWLPALSRLASLGYAVPGTVLALGLLVPLAALDNVVADALRRWFGLNSGLLLIGSGAALVLAYVVRFLAIAVSGVESGLSRISPRIDDAARTLGASAPEVMRKMHWPLARPAVAAAALLVFVDCLKELPATLLLRPLNVETLATTVYGHASRGAFEDGALAGLLIVLAGLYPAVRLARAGGRQA